VNSAYEARKIRTVAAAVVVAGRTAIDELAPNFPKEPPHEDSHQQPASAIQFALITAGWLSEWQ
jgi:hypothetical protein